MRSFPKGTVLNNNGRYREAADTFMEALIEVAPSLWTKNRYVAFQNYLAAVETCITKNDVKFIKRFIYNDEELHVYRASAASFLAMMKESLQEASHYIRLGLDFCNQSPPNHADRVVIFPRFGMDEGGKTIGSKIKQFKFCLETNLSVVEGKKLSASELQALSDAGCTKMYKVFCLAGKGEEAFLKRGHRRRKVLRLLRQECRRTGLGRTSDMQ